MVGLQDLNRPPGLLRPKYVLTLVNDPMTAGVLQQQPMSRALQLRLEMLMAGDGPVPDAQTGTVPSWLCSA